ncbi:hypothetical protein [Nonomuraea indica]|uniref:hypothetical protein n=1 Tax=Nonomuraea indica TaxID=1581193 RepID=UPI000C7A1CCE|nr:hypothetical protein [Nonomuraea indica]
MGFGFGVGVLTRGFGVVGLGFGVLTRVRVGVGVAVAVAVMVGVGVGVGVPVDRSAGAVSAGVVELVAAEQPAVRVAASMAAVRMLERIRGPFVWGEMGRAAR